MNLIDELCEDFDLKHLLINCTGITEDDACAPDEVLKPRIVSRLNDDDFISKDGANDFARYIRFYFKNYPYLGLHHSGRIAMYRSPPDDRKVMTYKEIIEASKVLDPEIKGFDGLFD